MCFHIPLPLLQNPLNADLLPRAGKSCWERKGRRGKSGSVSLREGMHLLRFFSLAKMDGEERTLAQPVYAPWAQRNLSLFWSYRCQMECWPREILKREGPESSSRPRMSEKRGEIKGAYDVFNHNPLWSWMIISSRNFFPGVFCILSTCWWNNQLMTQRQSRKGPGWHDAQGHLIVYFVIALPPLWWHRKGAHVQSNVIRIW